MYESIKICKPGTKFYEIGDIIQYISLGSTLRREIANKSGHHVCEVYAGHGIGEDMHMPPLVLHHSSRPVITWL